MVCPDTPDIRVYLVTPVTQDSAVKVVIQVILDIQDSRARVVILVHRDILGSMVHLDIAVIADFLGHQDIQAIQVRQDGRVIQGPRDGQDTPVRQDFPVRQAIPVRQDFPDIAEIIITNKGVQYA